MSGGMGPYTFNMLQHVVASLLLILARNPLKRITNMDGEPLKPCEYVNGVRKYFCSSIASSHHFELLVLGVTCAIFNFCGSTLNQVGLVTVQAGKSAFLTSLYVVFTPGIQYAMGGHGDSLSGYTWLAAGVSIIGSFFLAGCSETSIVNAINFGEIVTIVGAFFWALGILMIDYSVDRVNCVDLTCVQMFVSTILCAVLAFSFEPYGIWTLIDSTHIPMQTLTDYCWLVTVLTGAFEGVAFLLDTVGQMGTSGSRAALLMSMDSLVTVLVAYLILGETLTYPELFGCVLLLLATVVASTLGEGDDDEEEEVEEEQPEEERIKSSDAFKGELRKHHFLLLSRRGVPLRRRRAMSLGNVLHPYERAGGGERNEMKVESARTLFMNTKPNSFHGDIDALASAQDESLKPLVPQECTQPLYYGSLDKL